MAGGSPDDPGGDLDDQLLVAARDDHDAFARLYDRQYARVMAFFYRRTLCPHTSADLTAETFARLLATLERFDPAKGRAGAWTIGIAGNLYRQWSQQGAVSERLRRRLQIAVPDLVDEDYEAIERLVDLDAMREALKEALDSLSPALRDAIILRLLLSMSYPEVAAHLECSEIAARVRVSRGLAALAKIMEGKR